MRSHLGPFLFSFFTLMFIFLLQFIMKFVDQLVGKGLSSWVIGELIILNLAWMVILAVPMSVLVATLMAYGALSAQNEITAIKASGVSLYRMIAPIVILSVVLAYALTEFNNRVLPEANHRAKTLIIDIRRKKPTFAITPGLFSQDIPGYSILARKTFERSNDLEGLTIYDYTNPTNSVLVTAEQGKISFTSDYRKLVMDLSNGEIHQLQRNDVKNYRRVRFAKHRIVMNAEGFDFERSGENAFSKGDRELSALTMLAIVDSLKNLNVAASERALQASVRPEATPPTRMLLMPALSGRSIRSEAILRALNHSRSELGTIDNELMQIEYNQDRINEYWVEIHKKYSIPAACIVFVFIGAPLGIMARRGTFGIAATLSLGFFLMYWASLIGGEKLADRGFVSPWVGMWSANIALGILGILLTIRIARETTSIKWGSLQRFVPRAFRLPELPSDQQSPDT